LFETGQGINAIILRLRDRIETAKSDLEHATTPLSKEVWRVTIKHLQRVLDEELAKLNPPSNPKEYPE
jgi:hypothetical protein